MAKKTLEQQCTEFLRLAQVGLVLRGYDRATDIGDPILKEVWRFGRKVALAEKRRESNGDSD